MTKPKTIIKFFEDNKDNSIIFTLALAMVKEGKVPLEVIMSEVIIYQFNNISNYKHILKEAA